MSHSSMRVGRVPLTPLSLFLWDGHMASVYKSTSFAKPLVIFVGQKLCQTPRYFCGMGMASVYKSTSFAKERQEDCSERI